jgi:hypothetical protein
VSSSATITLNSISVRDIVQILVINQNGVVVKRISNGFQSSFDIDVSNFRNGVYSIIVKRKSNQENISASFTVQH